MDAGPYEDDAMQLAYAVMGQLWRAFTAEDVIGEITDALYDDAVIATLKQHAQHLDVHNVAQSSLDPYKYCCWFGCAVLTRISLIQGTDQHRCNFTKVSNAVVRTLCGMLDVDSYGYAKVPERTIRLLIQMLREEKRANLNHGIWQNGLYAAFHVAVAVGDWAPVQT